MEFAAIYHSNLMIKLRAIFIIHALLAISTGVRAQFLESPFLWEVSHVDTTSQYYYCFTALSCSGNNCTAALLLHDRSFQFGFSMMLSRTTDGGYTWSIQDPDLPDQCCNTNNMLRRIQQIDSLNVVAIGDTGLIIRTFDGGVTWQRQDCHTQADLSGVHFSDSLNGIAVTRSSNAIDRIVTTTDGGRHWSVVLPFNAQNLISCHCFGNGKYSVLRGYGPIYYTNDNWKTVETLPIVDSVSDSTWLYYYFRDYRYAGEDTIIAYGTYNFNGNHGVIIRSTDGGHVWQKPYTPQCFGLTSCTPFGHDTLLAAGFYGFCWIEFSTDNGETWTRDSLLSYDPRIGVSEADMCWGLDWVNSKPIGVFSGPPYQGTTSSILRGEKLTNSVNGDGKIHYHQRVFPNPARYEIYISSVEEASPYKIVDVFGRSVLSGMVLDRATLSVDVSSLSSGVYFVFVDDIHDGHPALVGKVLILGN
jgi:photosystem II stability/assembly factor-like uncharacterized protein